MTELPLNLEALAAGAEESPDPIIPDVESPFTPEEAAERQSFVDRALHGPRRERPTRKRREKLSDGPGSPPKVTPPKPRPGTLAKPLTELYVTLGAFLLPFDPACASAIINSAPKCADALENLARENPAVRKAIIALVETSVWGQVIVAHAPIMLAIAIHHIPGVREQMGNLASKIANPASGAEEYLKEQGTEAA